MDGRDATKRNRQRSEQQHRLDRARVKPRRKRAFRSDRCLLEEGWGSTRIEPGYVCVWAWAWRGAIATPMIVGLANGRKKSTMMG